MRICGTSAVESGYMALCYFNPNPPSKMKRKMKTFCNDKSYYCGIEFHFDHEANVIKVNNASKFGNSDSGVLVDAARSILNIMFQSFHVFSTSLMMYRAAFW